MSMEDKVNILLVDDQPERLMTYEAILANLGQNLVRAYSGTEALHQLMTTEFAAILLDVSMPGMDGFETAAMIHEHPRFEKTPIIFVTGVHVTDMDRLKGYAMGAVDYVYVPVVPEILRGKVQVLIELYLQRRELQRLNRRLTSAYSELSDAHRALQAQNTRELQELNQTLAQANAELEDANRALKEEMRERERVQQVLNAASRQAEIREKRRADQFAKLTNASLAMNSAMLLAERLKIITEHARNIIGAHQAITSMLDDADTTKTASAMSLSDKYSTWHESYAMPDGSELDLLTCRVNRRSMRLTDEELQRDTVWKRLTNKHKQLRPPMRAWLAAPLIGLNGKIIGIVQLSDKIEGEFTLDDENVLAQLAQLASVAIENSKLLEREQMAVKHRDEFLGIASHELRTPLTALKLQLQLAEKWKRYARVEVLPPGKVDRVFTTFDRQVGNLVRLVDDLLDVSRIVNNRMTLDPRPTDLSQVVTEVTDSFADELHAAGCNLALHTNGAVSGMWDRKRIEQVLSNLISNAIKYAPGKPIEIQLEQVDGMARLVVQDHGEGIPSENLEKIFERFERGTDHQSVAGLGLGLFISKQIVQLHGGSIRAESAASQGARFVIELPLNARFTHLDHQQSPAAIAD